MGTFVKAVCAMSGKYMTQSGLWVGPRLLLSTLHIHTFVQGIPSRGECELIRQSGQTFDVESEISSQVLSTHSPKVQLLDFSAEDDIGIFRLQDSFTPRENFVDPEWLMERNEVYNNHLPPGSNVGCLGYNSRISDDDKRRVTEIAASKLQLELHQFAAMVRFYRNPYD